MRTTIALMAVFAVGAPVAAAEPPIEVTSPDKTLTVTFQLDDGVPYYALKRGDVTILRPSRLGFRLKSGPPLDGGFRVLSKRQTPVDRTWQQVWGEQRVVRDRHTQLTVELGETSGAARRLEIVFRVFDDGIGFRYRIPKQPGIDAIEIMDELTEFRLTGDHRAWWIRPYLPDRYEYHYTDGPVSAINKAHTPITFETKEGLYLSIHEAALTDFASMVLHRREGTTLEAELVPWSDGVKVRGRAPMESPWRTIQVADRPGGLIESNLILNLNEPNRLKDVSWIKPGKYVGIWWENHLGKSTMDIGPKHGATTANAKHYIDFAAKHGFDAVLVEGWNQSWPDDWSFRGDEFSFTKSYPDYDLEEVARYAREHGVGLIMHHETAAAIANYEGQMEEAFALCQRLGIHRVKSGYVIPGQGIARIDENGKEQKEWHHGQFMVRHYLKVVETAARYQIMLDVHEPIKDTGIRRTYPNMLTREGACGQEFNAWGNEKRNPPNHTTILPFTRLLAGPMDFTPGIFDLLFKEYRGDNRVSTTLAKQLALYVVIYSPLQMAADLPENYEANPRPFQFIKDVPVDWDRTVVLNGAIGDYVTIARKDHNSDDWYLGSITDEHARVLSAPLDFLDAGRTYVAQIYRDGDDADWDTNPYSIAIEQRKVTAKDRLDLRLAAGGGVAVRIRPAG